MTDNNKLVYLVIMTLKPVPREAYLRDGAKENAYTQSLMEQGVITSFYVTPDHRDYWISFAVESEQALQETLQAFPFYPYFDYQVRPVMDMVAAVADGLTDPNLDS